MAAAHKPAGALSSEERQRIVDLLPTGMSCRQIAARVGRSRQTVSVVARQVGHRWGAVNAQRAAEANRAYGDERRAEQVLVLAEKLDAVLPRLTEPSELVDFSAVKLEHRVHKLDRPDPRQLRDLATAIKNLTSAIKDLLPDSAGEGLGAVQEYLRQQKGTQ